MLAEHRRALWLCEFAEQDYAEWRTPIGAVHDALVDPAEHIKRRVDSGVFRAAFNRDNARHFEPRDRGQRSERRTSIREVPCWERVCLMPTAASIEPPMESMRCEPRKHRYVVPSIRCLYQKSSAWLEHACDFCKDKFGLVEMLEHVVGEHKVKGSIAKWKPGSITYTSAVDLAIGRNGTVDVDAKHRMLGCLEVHGSHAPRACAQIQRDRVRRETCEHALAQKLVIPLGVDAGVPTPVEPGNNGGHDLEASH